MGQVLRQLLFVLIAFAIAIAMNYFTMALKVSHLVGDNQSLIHWEDRIFTGRWKRI